jgi:hypothetical protein
MKFSHEKFTAIEVKPEGASPTRLATLTACPPACCRQGWPNGYPLSVDTEVTEKTITYVHINIQTKLILS